MKKAPIGVSLAAVSVVVMLLVGCGKQPTRHFSQAIPTWGSGHRLLWLDIKGVGQTRQERVLMSDWRGHSLRQLVQFKQGIWVVDPLLASEDGKWVSFVSGERQTSHLCLIRLVGGGNPHFYCPVKADDIYAFSPDNRWLAYNYYGIVHLYQLTSGRDVIASSTISSDLRVAWTADSKGVFYGGYRQRLQAGYSFKKIVLRYAGIDGSTWVVKGTRSRSIFVLGRVSSNDILLWSFVEKKDYLFDPSTHRLSQVSAPLTLNSVVTHPGVVTFSGDGREMAIVDSQRHWRVCPTSALTAGLRWAQCVELPSAPGIENPYEPASFKGILSFSGDAAIDYRATPHSDSSSLVDLTTGKQLPLFSYKRR